MPNLNVSSPSFRGSQAATFDQSLTNLLDTFKDVTTNKDKSIRVYQNPKSSSGNYITKMHTGISLFGVSAKVKAERREAAVQVVTNAIKKEFGCSDEVAKALIAHVRNGSTDRVSLRNLREIAAVGQSFVDQVARIDDTLKAFQTKSPLTGGQMCTKSDLAVLKDTPMLKGLLDKVKTGDVAANDQLRKLMVAVNNDSVRRQVLGEDGVTNNKGNLKELHNALKDALAEAFGHHVEAELQKPSAVTFQNTNGTQMYDSQKISDFDGITFQGLQDAQNKWKISDSGANGALLIRGSGLPYGGVIVKTEDSGHAQVIGDISGYIDSVRKALPNGLPIEGMVVTPMNVKQSDLTNVFQMVDQQAKTSDDQGFRMDSLKAKLNGIDSGDAVMMKAMFIENATDVDKLPLGTKVKLLHTPEFPHSLGQAMVLGSLFGLGDHVGIQHSDERAFTNLSNLMIKNDTGKLVFIDYGPCKDPNTGKPVRSSQTLKDDFGAVVDLAKKIAANPQDIQTLTENSALSSVLYAAFTPSTEGTLFRREEGAALNNLSPEVQKQFTLNTLIGAMDALLLVADNPTAFESGKPMFEDPGDVTKFVTAMKTDLQNLKQQLSAL